MHTRRPSSGGQMAALTPATASLSAFGTANKQSRTASSPGAKCTERLAQFKRRHREVTEHAPSHNGQRSM
eukprot:COSAG06_NODE_267_length_18822_cov_26.254607_8_plen_70_part_00